MTFDKCILDEDGIKVFIERLDTKKLRAIKYLVYLKRNSSLSLHRGLNLLLRELSSLETLNLDPHVQMHDEVLCILDGVRLPSLNIMNLGCPMDDNKPKIDFDFFTIGSSELKIYLVFSESENYIEQCVQSARFISAFGLKIFLDPNNPLLFFCNNPLKLARHIDFKYFSRISKVVLINCCISDDEVELITEPLKFWSVLQIVHLDFNNISCRGAKLLSRTLSKAIDLDVFSINCNRIGDAGALELANALNSLSHLRLFDCRYNPISEEGSLELPLVLKKFNMIVKFYFTVIDTCDFPLMKLF